MITRFSKPEMGQAAQREMLAGEDALVEHDFDEAIRHIKKALRLLKHAKHTQEYVKDLNILGMVHSMASDESAALDCYLESLATAAVMKSNEMKALSYSGIGSCYQKMGHYKEALVYFRNARREHQRCEVSEEEDRAMWSTFNYLYIEGFSGD